MVDFGLQQIENRALKTNDCGTLCELGKWTCAGGLLVSLMLGYAWIHHEILTINYEMQRLLDENAGLNRANASLQSELAAMTDPQELDAAAERLGLIHSNEHTVTILQAPRSAKSDNVLAQSATPAGVALE